MTQLEATDSLLLAVDPLRGLRWFERDLGRMAALDPKIHETQRLIVQHLDELSGQEEWSTALAPVLWSQARGWLQNSQTLTAMRLALGDGDNILRSVEDALATTLSHEVLMAVIQETTQLTNSDSPPGVLLQTASEEISQGSTQFASEKGALAAIAIVAIVVIVVIVAIAVAVS